MSARKGTRSQIFEYKKIRQMYGYSGLFFQLENGSFFTTINIKHLL